MNFIHKPNPMNIFGIDETSNDSYVVEELSFDEVIEITGITPVDSVRRIRQKHIAALRGDYDDAYADQDFV
jgi:hypothetical protein